MPKKALLIVDVQNDFLPGGALAVKEGNSILDKLDALVTLPFDHIIGSKDWHPRNHVSFAETHQKNIGDKIIIKGIEQILWPAHCVQQTYGAEFPVRPFTGKIQKVFYKGTDVDIDSYSAFFDNGRLKSTGLKEYLKQLEAEEVYLAGLATDYCIKYSTLDALDLGFKVFIMMDACKGINLNTNDVENALEYMKNSGAILTSVQNVANSIEPFSL